MLNSTRRVAIAWLVVLAAGCSDNGGDSGGELSPSKAAFTRLVQPWTGDLESMAERGFVRVLTVNSPVLYFNGRGRQRGVVYDMVRRFEDHLNKTLQKRNRRVQVMVLPVARDELIPRLLRGEGDLAVAQLTITPQRRTLVDFSIPVSRNVAEVLVTGPESPPIDRLEDLAGNEVFLRASSSYAKHLVGVNQRLAANGLPPIETYPVDERLEAGDILEMVHAGLAPATFVDDALARLYGQIFTDLQVHEDIALNNDGNIGWAFRKGSSQLASMVNDFVKANREGTLVGNVLLDRYLKDTRWVGHPRDPRGMERYRSTLTLFKKYAERYDLDHLLLVAQAYQESRLDHSLRSPAGAIGVMQMLPSTAKDKNVGIADITELENNIHAGAKYLRWMMDRYYDDAGITRMEQELFALASYNAGPARVARVRQQALAQGLDPDRWFNNVEIVASRQVGREPVQYVANVYKYYVAYSTLEASSKARGV